MYTGGSIVFNTLNHDFSKRRHNYQTSVSSHAMSMTTIPTDGAIDIMNSKKGDGSFLSRSWELGA